MSKAGGRCVDVNRDQRQYRTNVGQALTAPDLFYENRYSHTRMVNPDFIKLSESMNAKALRVSSIEELPAKMKEFLEYDNSRPIVMECLVSSEHVYPMVPAGKALHEQIVSFVLRICGSFPV